VISKACRRRVGLCPLCRNPGFVQGFIDETGRLVIPPKRWEWRYESFREGLARYPQRLGIIDHEGRVVIEASSTKHQIFRTARFVRLFGKEQVRLH